MIQTSLQICIWIMFSNLTVVPRTVRSDCCTENIIIARMQCYFMRNHNDEECGERSYVYGSSHSNQRIEALWSQFRRVKTTYIINFFKTLTEETKYNSEDHLHKSCAWYSFGDLIQTELNNFREQWNNHYVCRGWDTEVYDRPDSICHFPKNWFSDQSLGVAPACWDHKIIFKQDKWKR